MPENPKKTMEKLERIAQAWEDVAPEASFAGMKLDEFKARIKPSLDVRDEISDLENQMDNALQKRDAVDAASSKFGQFVVNSVAGDPNFGKDSGLYKAMGYVTTSERKSGLTRKKKPANDEDK